MPTPSPFPVADAVQGIAGLVQTGVGLMNQSKLKREAAQSAANRPQYQISPLAGQELSLSQSELANGMSAGAEKAYNDLNNQQFSSSVGSIIRSGGNVNSIGALYGNNMDGRLRLAQLKDNVRLNQINNYVKANNSMQDQQQTQWQLNKYAPWQDNAQAIAQARQAASQQVNNGLNTLTAGVMNGSQSMQEDNKLGSPLIFNRNASAVDAPNAPAPINNYIPNNYNFNGASTLNTANMPSYNPSL